MGNCGCLGKKLIKTKFVKTNGSNDSEVNKVFSINSEIDQINNDDINFTNNSEKRKTLILQIIVKKEKQNIIKQRKQ